MLIFSAKTRQIIDVAMATFGNVERWDVWNTWIQANSMIWRAGESWHDGKPELPREVAVAALNALDGLKRRKRDQRDMPGLAADKVSDLDNDLTLIRSAERFLTEWAPPPSPSHSI